MVTDPKQLPLRDIHLPDPVSWWPPASGWWMLLVLGAALLTGIWLWKRAKKDRLASLKSLSLQDLKKIRHDYAHHRDCQRLVRELSVLLRRISISYWPRERSASLTGEAWLKFLDQLLEDEPFSKGPGKVLIEGPYRPHPKFDADALLELCNSWIGALPEAAEDTQP